MVITLQKSVKDIVSGDIDVYLHVTEYKLIVLKGKEFRYRSMQDLVNKRLSLIRAPSINAEMQLSMLTLGRVDALMGNTEVTAYIANKIGLGDKITFLPNSTLAQFEFYIIISKNSKIADLVGFHQTLREFSHQMEVDGTIENI